MEEAVRAIAAALDSGRPTQAGRPGPPPGGATGGAVR
jgi:hypothetical protein